ncbi:uncharacterized protein N7446_004879 [Penicillium canescens]|uniref:Yeast cell wall synthesis Kre9/Knh1-like N-terminal domain-containing protein n=1 Tax=Penicillium canescens TaxID=5083 RepID=A0AAD6I0G0_PENCN|nr:uncharacterized protein N7446_004879 [Penicillium canescens]KAJ6026521.1 hypothetical protein N7460_011338 [Penicillium canescens]KAJ6039805.1 hypothetical protein N7444_008710 [Penicillium canescens]KAJ6067842.1 hypothetical protein N7446_004879 [Penicillium canescens]
MIFSKSVIAAVATLVTLGLADPLSFTAWPTEPLEAGKPVTLRWAGGVHPDQPVTIALREGPSGNLRDVKVITDQAKDGSFTWTPDNDVKSGRTYAFQISQEDETNYTALLHSAGDKPVEDNASTTGAGTTSAPNSQTTAGTRTTDATSSGSKALISSSANGSSTPSGSAAASSSSASSTDVPMITDIRNGKEASSTGSVQNDAASIPQSSMQFVLGVAGLLVYLVQ